MIKLTAIGHLGKDAIINNVSGKQVINFSIAHTEKFTTNGEQKEKTIWVECAYWSDSKVGPYLKKGVQVYVEGTPEVRTYPKNDGSTGASLSLRVFSVQLLGGNQSAHPQQQQSSHPDENGIKPMITPAGNDDLPF